jgi:hypothetical protein
MTRIRAPVWSEPWSLLSLSLSLARARALSLCVSVSVNRSAFRKTPSAHASPRSGCFAAPTHRSYSAAWVLAYYRRHIFGRTGGTTTTQWVGAAWFRSMRRCCSGSRSGRRRGGCSRRCWTAWAAAATVSPFLSWIGSPCLRHCVHGASIGGQQLELPALDHAELFNRRGVCAEKLGQHEAALADYGDGVATLAAGARRLMLCGAPSLLTTQSSTRETHTTQNSTKSGGREEIDQRPDRTGAGGDDGFY